MRNFEKIKNNKTLYSFIIVAVLWEILHITMKANIIPGPYETIVEFLKLIRGNLLIHTLVSFYRIAIATFISMAVGIPLGLWVGTSSKADRIISPVVYILYPLPKIAFLPVFMIMFGLGDLSKFVLIATIVVFQVMLSVRDGVREIPIQLYNSVKTLGLNQRQIYKELLLPAALPKIISALRVSTGISISVLFFGENYATTYGLGYFIMNAWAMVDYVQMFAGILALSLMGLIIFKLIDLAEKKLCPWMFI